jgi:hypothetical protein
MRGESQEGGGEEEAAQTVQTRPFSPTPPVGTVQNAARPSSRCAGTVQTVPASPTLSSVGNVQSDPFAPTGQSGENMRGNSSAILDSGIHHTLKNLSRF